MGLTYQQLNRDKDGAFKIANLAKMDTPNDTQHK